jgi:hypothetical protein
MSQSLARQPLGCPKVKRVPFIPAFEGGCDAQRRIARGLTAARNLPTIGAL